MQIFENVNLNKPKTDTDVMLFISYKEAKILVEAMEEYTKNNKRKTNAKKMYKQMYKDLPY